MKVDHANINKMPPNPCYDWVWIKMHKIMYKQCSTKKTTNAVKSTFVVFWFVSKL